MRKLTECFTLTLFQLGKNNFNTFACWTYFHLGSMG